MSEDKSSKTEKATPQKKKQAMEEGNVARTQDLSMWLTVLVFVFVGPIIIRRLFDDVSLLLEWIGRIIAAPDLTAATQFFRSGLLGALWLILPVALACMVMGALGHIVQGGAKIYGKRFKPKWKKLNPWTGLKNMFGMQAAWTFVKTLLKFGVFGTIAYIAVQGTIATVATSGRYSVGTLLSISSGTAMNVMRDIAIVGLIIAAFDYAVERHRVEKSLRMSMYEIKKESKQQEGDPHVKGQRRAKQREMGRMRMMAAVGEASVVVTNPTHVAVALKYEQGEGAPQVVAKGAGHLAQRIRDEAQAHEVPVVRDVIVARMLFKLCEVEDYIPFELYDAIANVLAFVMRMSDLQRTDRVHTSPLRHPNYNGVDLPEDLSDEALGITAHASPERDVGRAPGVSDPAA